MFCASRADAPELIAKYLLSNRDCGYHLTKVYMDNEFNTQEINALFTPEGITPVPCPPHVHE